MHGREAIQTLDVISNSLVVREIDRPYLLLLFRFMKC